MQARHVIIADSTIVFTQFNSEFHTRVKSVAPFAVLQNKFLINGFLVPETPGPKSMTRAMLVIVDHQIMPQ